MKRRVIAALASILLAALSAAVLLSYVSSADRRAMADLQPVTVLVAAAPVTAGTSSDQLTELVAEKSVPRTAVVPGAISRLSEIAGKVATTDLQPGEQLLASRFSDPESLKQDQPVTVPPGLQQLAVQLDPQRVVGGGLTAGDRVGVFVSIGKDHTDGRTHLVLHKVLVTRVQGAVTSDPSDSPSDPPQTSGSAGSTKPADASPSAPTTVDPVPQSSLIVTLALPAADAERLVFAGEYGHLWLSLEDQKSSTSGTRTVTQENELS